MSSPDPAAGSATGTRATRLGRTLSAPWLAWTLVGGALALAYPLLADVVPHDGAHLLVAASAAVLAVVGVWRNAAEPRGGWVFVTSGLVLFVLGDVLYTAQTSLTGSEPSFPGLPDLVYLPGAASLVVGGVLLAWRRHRGATARAMIDAGLIAVSVAVLLWLAIGAETLRGPEASFGVVAVGLAYPLADAALIGAAAALVLGGRNAPVALRLLVAAFAVMFACDAVYLTQATVGGYSVGGVLDSGWLLSYVLIAAAALHPSSSIVATPLPPRMIHLGFRHVTAMALPVLVAATSLVMVAHTVAVQDPERFLIDLTVLVPAGVVIVVLLLWRVANVSNELVRTAGERDLGRQRELVVAEVTSQLALAASIAEVQAALEHATGLLADPHERITLDLGDRSVPHGSAHRFDVAGGRAALVVESGRELDDGQRRSLERLTADVAMALDRCQLAQDLRASERRFRSLVRHAPDAITVHDADGSLFYVSPALGHILGLPEDELVGIRWADLVHPDDVGLVLDPELDDGRVGTRVVVLRLRRGDGTWCSVETRLTDLRHDPSVGGIVANHRDVTERLRLQRQLEHQATHDPLTGAANRRRFADEVRHTGAPGTDAVIFLDLDHFKAINDRLGHAAGDQVLCAVAARLRRAVRPDDLVARLGGDEFAVLLRDTDPATASHTADRLLDAIVAPIDLGGEQVTIGASLGLATAPADASEHDLLRDADLAMYAAKSGGRGRVEQATPRIREQTDRRRSLESDLRAALAGGDLTLRHRPVVDLRTGELVGAQTGLHWIHPTQGEVHADRFIPVAERIGVLDALATWTFQEACWSVRSWIEHDAAFTIAVPFPGVALRDPGAAERFEAILQATGLPGHHLVLQIRGSELLDPTPATEHNLRRLRDAGVRIRATNLGTNTPMRVVRDAPVDEVLLPAELVAGITAGPEDAALGRAVLLLAEGFGLDVVADGVETDEHVAALVARGARTGAGPWAGAALAPDELTRRVSAAPSTLVAPPG